MILQKDHSWISENKETSHSNDLQQVSRMCHHTTARVEHESDAEIRWLKSGVGYDLAITLINRHGPNFHHKNEIIRHLHFKTTSWMLMCCYGLLCFIFSPHVNIWLWHLSVEEKSILTTLRWHEQYKQNMHTLVIIFCKMVSFHHIYRYINLSLWHSRHTILSIFKGKNLY
jgi:hypothetical protein